MEFPDFLCKYSIGIANSIAKAAGYDWRKTMEYARALNVSVLQLYLSPGDDTEKELQNLASNLPEDWQAFFHLPSCPPAEISFYLRAVSEYFPSSVLVQHETYLDDAAVTAIRKAGFILAPENDAALPKDLYSFRHLLEDLLHKQNTEIVPVLDLSRLFHQFHPHYDYPTITREALQILRFVNEAHLPLILHVIDHVSPAAETANWRPLFEGDLPWEKILQEIVRRSVRLHSIIFEYESLTDTEESIHNLLKHFPETFRQ